MAIALVPKYVRALAEQLNAYYRVFRGTDPDSIDLRLNGGGRFAVHHSGTNAVVFQVTDAGATGAYQPGDITNPDLADGAVTSAKIADDTIVNADINGAAAIALTKLQHVGANSVLRSTGTQNVGGQVVSADIANDTIVDGDINSAAAILVTKLQHVGPGNVLRSNGTTNVGGPLVAADIPNNTITSAKIVDNEIVNADINSAAGIAYGKLALTNGITNADINAAAGIAPSKLAAVTAGQVLKDTGSGVVGGGLLVDANVAAAGTANIALGKLAPGASGLVKSNGTAISAGNQLVAADLPTGGSAIITSAMIADDTIVNADINGAAAIALGKLAPGASGLVKSNGTAISAGNQLVAADLPTGGSAIITSAMIVDGTIATADMTVNTINGDRIAMGTLPGDRITGGAPPPSGAGVADAYKVYATGSAGTAVSLQQVVTAMLAANAVHQLTHAQGPATNFGTAVAADITGVSATLTLTGGDLLVWAIAGVSHSVSGGRWQANIDVPGVASGPFSIIGSVNSLPIMSVAFLRVAAPAAATRTASLRITPFDAGTLSVLANCAFIVAMEVKR